MALAISHSFPHSPWHYLKTLRFPVDDDVTLQCYQNHWRQQPLVHFLHGIGLSGLTYWPLLEPLLERHDLFIHNTQAHGESDVGHHFIGWNATSERCVQVLNQQKAKLGTVPIIGMGHSFGAVLSILMAHQNPQLFSGLVLLDPVLFPRSVILGQAACKAMGVLHYNSLARKARKRQSTYSSRQQAYWQLHNKGLFAQWRSDYFDSYLDYNWYADKKGAVRMATPPEFEAQVFSDYPQALWSALASLEIPIVIIYGDRTYSWIYHSIQKAALLNSHITVRKAPGGHCFMMQNPYQASALVDQGLRYMSASQDFISRQNRHHWAFP